MTSIVRPLHARNRKLGGGGEVDYIGRDIGYEYRREFGAYLRQKRLDMGLTQKQVADALGVQPSAVSSMEIGRIALPADRAEALADALNIDHGEMGRQYLRWSNPWIYKMIFNARDRRLLDDLASIPSRVGVNPAVLPRTSKS